MTDATDIDARIRALKAKLAERQAKAEIVRAASEQGAEAKRIELEIEVLDAIELNGGMSALGQTVARVDVTHPDGTLIGVVLVKTAPRPTWNAFANKLEQAKGTEKDDLKGKLWRACRLWPDQDRVEALIEQKPFLADRLCSAIGTLAGVQEEVIAGKS